MNQPRLKRRHILLVGLISLGVISSLLATQGCVGQQIDGTNLQVTQTATDFLPLTPNVSELETGASPTSITATSNPGDNFQLVWGDFLPPSIDPVTPIPPPQSELSVPDEVLVWVLLGSDAEPPFIGRTPAIHLLFIHPRFSKASLVSIPGDLFVYIPGYTMQRINAAYALGGIETLRQTLTYNFGVTPTRFVLAHPGDFQWLVDDINGIEITVFYPMPQACGGIRAGLVEMDGTLALCYGTYRDGQDEIDRMRRQQQLLRAIFYKLTQDGNLINLPTFYASFEGWIKTDLSLSELLGYVPLALRLADPNRIGYFMVGWDQITLWELPGYTQTQVFLPKEKDVKILLEQAVERLLDPEPLTGQVRTLEAQLTAAYKETITTVTPTISTQTPTPTPSSTGTLEGPSATKTPTPQGYP